MSESQECQFCKKTFKTANILAQHKKRTKYCLTLQGKENKNFTCSYCDKSLVTNERLLTHTAICKEKKRKDAEEKNSNLKSTHKKEIKDILKRMEDKDKLNTEKLEDKDRYYNEQIDTLKQTIAKLEAKLEKFEDAVISSKKPTNTTNNNNTNITLNLNDTERFRSIIEEKLTKHVVCNGQSGLAKFAVENLLKDAAGKLMYKCVDPSRHNFEFTNSDGVVEKDVKAIKLKRALIDGDVMTKAKNAGNEIWTREDGSTDNDRYLASSGKVMEIITVDRDDTKFRTELSALTS
jgi:hypothetical protein